MTKLRVLDLFSGIGGFSLGLERTGGFETVAFCEIEEFPRRVLAKHWPGVPNLGDVTVAEFPNADVVVGGFPCQDISGAGKRAGVSGARSGLYRELVRAIRVVRPQYAILENVADLLSGPLEQPGEWFHQVLGDLAEVGACVEWDCIPAKALGAPHERDRVWIVVTDTDQWGGEVRRSQPIRRGREGAIESDVAGSASDAAGAHDGNGHSEPAERQKPQSGNCLGARDSADAASIGLRSWGPGRPPDSFAWIRNATCGNAAHAHGARHAIGEGERGDACEEQPTPERNSGPDVWKYGWPDEPALLGMDDGVSDWSHRVKAIGNALIPDIPEMIGRAILAAIEPTSRTVPL